MSRIAIAAIALGVAAGSCQRPQGSATSSGPEPSSARSSAASSSAASSSAASAPAKADPPPAQRGFGLHDPSVAIDAAGERLLVAGTRVGNDAKPDVYRCALDGAGCVHLDVSAGLSVRTGHEVKIVIDREGGQLLLVMDNWVDHKNDHRLALIRCRLDGTGCAGGDVPGGALKSFRWSVPSLSAALDPVNRRLLTAVIGHEAALFRCHLDSAVCDRTALGPEVAINQRPVAMVDPIAKKLLVVARLRSGALSLVRCELDGTSCGARDLLKSADGLPLLQAALDVQRRRLFVLLAAAPLKLLRCDADGAGCGITNIAVSAPLELRSYPPVVIDPPSGKLFVVANTASPKNGVAVFQCEPSAGCALFTTRPGLPHDIASTALDEKNRRFVFVAPGALVSPGPEEQAMMLVPLP